MLFKMRFISRHGLTCVAVAVLLALERSFPGNGTKIQSGKTLNRFSRLHSFFFSNEIKRYLLLKQLSNSTFDK